MPMALVRMRPRGVCCIQRSATVPPINAPISDAICTNRIALTPALPWPRPNFSLRMSGIQSRTTQPAMAGSVK